MIRGHTHLADGAEASIVGSLAGWRDGDQLMATYRCHGYPLVLGTSPSAMMAEIFGREGGLCQRTRRVDAPDRRRTRLHGHLGDRRRRHPAGDRAGVGGPDPQADEVVLCFFGDGASKQGAFAESLNIASLWKLPIVYVMENNGYNVVTQSHQEDANAAAGEPLAIKAKAFSMPGETVDGADPLAVHEVVGAAVARARTGDGPTLVESKVYRLSAHGNIIAPPGVPLHYPEHEAIEVFGDPEQYEAALRGDPVPRFRGILVTDGMLTPEAADEITAKVQAEMQEAVDFGLKSPHPEPSAALEYVYA